MTELREDVPRLSIIRESEKETDSTVPETDAPANHDTRDKGPPTPQAEGEAPGDGKELKKVTAQVSRQIHSQPASPSQVPVHNRYEAL